MNTISRTFIGNIEPTIDVKSLVIANDHSKFAYAFGKTGKGGPGTAYDIMVNDQVVACDFEKPESESLVFSYDSKHFAFCGKRDDNYYYYYIDGKISAPSLEAGSPIFSPDSLKSACRFRERVNLGYYTLNDFKYDHDFKGVMHFSFSPDSKRVAYTGASKISKKLIVMIDEKESGYIDAIGRPGVVFSPDSKNYCFLYQDTAKFYIAFNEMVFGPYDEITNYPIFSPDSQKLVYTVNKEDKTAIFLNGECIQEVAAIGSEGIIFSPDSKKIGFIFRKNGIEGWFMGLFDILNRKLLHENNSFNGIGINSPMFSKDGNHLAWELQELNGKWYILRDDHKGPSLTGLSYPAFSNDSNFFHYIMVHDDMEQLSINDRVQRRIKSGGIGGTFCSFSDDSKHIAYDFNTGNGFKINLDDQEYGPFPGFLKKSKLYFGRDFLRALVIENYQITKVEIQFDPDFNFLEKFCRV